MAVGILDGGDLCFVVIELLLLALLGGCALGSFDIVSNRVHVSAAVGEDALHGQDLAVYVIEFLADFFASGLGLLISLRVRLLESQVVGTALHVFFGCGRFGAGCLKESRVAIFPFVLVRLPGALAESFVP